MTTIYDSATIKTKRGETIVAIWISKSLTIDEIGKHINKRCFEKEEVLSFALEEEPNLPLSPNLKPHILLKGSTPLTIICSVLNNPLPLNPLLKDLKLQNNI